MVSVSHISGLVVSFPISCPSLDSHDVITSAPWRTLLPVARDSSKAHQLMGFAVGRTETRDTRHLLIRLKIVKSASRHDRSRVAWGTATIPTRRFKVLKRQPRMRSVLRRCPSCSRVCTVDMAKVHRVCRREWISLSGGRLQRCAILCGEACSLPRHFFVWASVCPVCPVPQAVCEDNRRVVNTVQCNKFVSWHKIISNPTYSAGVN
jgi:hypothetical protein